MKVADLIALFRSDVRDEATPTLWTDSEVVRYLNSALNQLAVQADYFYDTTTYKGVRFIATDPLIPTATIPAAESTVPTTPSLAPILWIRRAKVAGQFAPMHVLTIDQLENGGPLFDDYGIASLSNWETATGTPRVIITDMVENAYRLAPIPAVDGTLDLFVFRRPRFVLSATNDSDWSATCATDLKGLGGIQTEEHELMLLDWMKHLAYQKNDADTYDTDESVRFGNEFIAKATQLKRELQRRRFPSGPIAYGGL